MGTDISDAAGTAKGVGSLYLDGVGHGRPRGRKVDCTPNRFGVRSCQDGSPNGAPRTAERRNAANSASVYGAWNVLQPTITKSRTIGNSPSP